MYVLCRLGCGGMRNQDTGEIEYPMDGLAQKAEREYNCVWHIQVLHTRLVQVNISALSMQRSPNCADNYLKAHV